MAMTHEEQFGPVARRMRKLRRGFRWTAKTILGAPRTMLVETRWRLGDEIMMLPVFDAMRHKYPAAHIAVLTNYPELYENHPFVDSVNDVPDKLDRHLLLRGAPRTAYRLSHYARRAGVPLPKLRPHLYYDDWTAPPLPELPGGEGPLIALAQGASWSTKRWLPERWRELARALEERGARLVELGKGEAAIGAGLCLVDRTTVREAACVLHHADLLVCCDSGLMHLALAAATPVVALFGPTDPAILIRNEPNFTAIRSTLPCSGHWNRPGGNAREGVCPEGHACCLADISVDQVLDAAGARVILTNEGGHG